MSAMAGELKGLGRGLGALLGAAPTVSGSRGGGTLPVAMMQPGAFQPRREIHQQPLEELAASIRASGVIEPIVVRRLPGGEAGAGGARYEIVAGERRWRAAKLAGLSDIPTIVREMSNREAVAVALIENIQREELTAAEEARALKRLMAEFELTQQEAADSVGRSRAAVSNLLRLLELPEAVVAMIDAKTLSMGHARALLGLRSADEQQKLAAYVVGRALSVRETEALVRKALAQASGSVSRPSPGELSVVSEVVRTPAFRVRVHQKTSGAGSLVVEFADAKSRDAMIEAVKQVAEDSVSWNISVEQ
jgi:ParB family transcriptional regulator, chromosome partitioning protein